MEGLLARLGRKDYKQEEFDRAKHAIDQQLAAYRKLLKAIDGAKPDAKVTSALEAFEPLFLNNLTLALDRFFVHRVRLVAGKDCNPLNEVELITESLMNNDAVLQGNKVIAYSCDQSGARLGIGDRVKFSLAQFERLSKAFFAEIEAKFM